MNLKNNSKMKKGDMIIIITGLLLAGIVWMVNYSKASGDKVKITAQGKCREYSLFENETIRVTNEKGDYNTIIIENGEVYMENASCPDQICVHHKGVSRNGESILCLPNEVYVEVESIKEKEIDN